VDGLFRRNRAREFAGCHLCAVFLLAGSLGFYVPLMYALTAENFPTRARATGVSLTEGAGHIGGAVGPILGLALYAWGGIGSGLHNGVPVYGCLGAADRTAAAVHIVDAGGGSEPADAQA
jgi:MFS family permease